MPNLDEGKNFVDNFLAHYASEFYDPAKAHQYYELNKQLKGGGAPAAKQTKDQRQQKVATAQNQREALSYANKQISGKRQTELKDAQTAQQARIAALHANVTKRSVEIKQKLEQALVKLREESDKTRKALVFNVIPSNASPQVRAFLEKQNAKLRDTAKKETAAADKKLSVASNAAQKASQDAIASLSNEMKLAIAAAREAYTQGRQQTVAKYKTVAETERTNIQTQVR